MDKATVYIATCIVEPYKIHQTSSFDPFCVPIYKLCLEVLPFLLTCIYCVTFSGLTDEDWDGQLVVTVKDFNLALETLQLSVSAAELAKYKELHKSMTNSTATST